MKAENKKTGRKGLPPGDHRWQWMAAAAAGTAAGVTAAQAGEMTVPLSNNYISAAAGNHLNLDLAGDGVHNNLMLSNSAATSTLQFDSTFKTIVGTTGLGSPIFSTRTNFYDVKSAKVNINGEQAFAFWSNTTISNSATTYSNGFSIYASDTAGPRTFGVDFTFDGDPAINGGASTPARLTFETIAEGPGNVEVELVSFTYDQTVTNTPLEMLEEAKAELAGLLPAIRQHTVRADFVEGLTPLEIAGLHVDEDMVKCVDPRNFESGGLLLNPARGEDVFQYCNNVVEILLPYSRGDSPFAAEVRSIIELITEADVQLATNAYDDATGLSTYQADNAAGALDEADNFEVDGHFLEAISEAQAAWRYVIIP